MGKQPICIYDPFRIKFIPPIQFCDFLCVQILVLYSLVPDQSFSYALDACHSSYNVLLLYDYGVHVIWEIMHIYDVWNDN